MFKDLVLPITSTPGDSDAINVAVALAGAFDARLTVLEMVNLPIPANDSWGLTPYATMTSVHSRLRAQGEINVGRLRERLDKEAIQSEVRLVEALFGEPEWVAAHHAHYADLAILAGAFRDTGDDAVTRTYFGGLLLESGRPVLVVPPGSKIEPALKRIMLAWRPTRDAARALHDAMPFIERADQVDILVVNAARGELGHGDEPGADVAAHIARHGVNANVVRRDAGARPVSSVLLEHARESRAQLIVAGGYGHSRMREWVMGGVTRELLISAPIPVLYSH